MQKREKILAAALGGTVLCLFIGPMFYEQVMAPLRVLEGQEAQLTVDSKRLFSQLIALRGKESEIKKWRALSLPPDPLDAQRLYQEWLTTLAQLSGFEVSKVTLEARAAEGDTFVRIPITITAKAQLQELASFLERFESVQLLHRISKCDVSSPSNEGNPRLNVTITAEGLSLPSAPPRTRLFPLTELAEAIRKDTQTITVVNGKGFPTEVPFCIRIGNEFLNVTKIDGNEWTVKRGVEKSFADNHPANANVEEFPLRSTQDVSEATVAMWSRSVFTKPSAQVNYVPKLANTTPPVAIRGQPWSWKLEVSGWNPAFGTPKFEVLTAPAGMELDEKSGSLNWKVAPEADVGMQPIQILVWGTNGRNSGFTPTVNLRVRDPNQPPKFEDVKPLKFYIGRETKVKISANDPDGDSSKLTYKIVDGPAGLTIDATTGELRWSPEDSLAPQELSVTLEVKDQDDMPESATVKLAATLEEDSAKFTYLTGYLKRTNGVEECLINDRVTNRSTVVRKGDRLQVAEFDMLIEEIGKTFVLVKRGNDIYRWQFEQPLTEMTLVKDAGKPLDVSAPAANEQGTAR